MLKKEFDNEGDKEKAELYQRQIELLEKQIEQLEKQVDRKDQQLEQLHIMLQQSQNNVKQLTGEVERRSFIDRIKDFLVVGRKKVELSNIKKEFLGCCRYWQHFFYLIS